MSDTPRSIRLNKGHREDMLDAVMQQWAKTNPAPADSTFEAFVRATLQHLLSAKKNAPAEMKALKHLVQRNQQGLALKPDIPDNLKDHVTFETEADFKLEVQLDNGDRGAIYVFQLPAAMADELGIPYLNTYTDGSRNDVYPNYVVNDRITMAKFINRGDYINLVIPREFGPYTIYREGQQALRQWEDEKSKIRGEIRDYLDQFNTTGQIREQWPEMEQYLPAHIADPARVINLPALTRSRLNERLGIN